MRKRDFIVDYEIHGTLYLSVRHESNARLRADALLRSAISDLQDVSVYCEPEISSPIDTEKRYPKPKKGHLP